MVKKSRSVATQQNSSYASYYEKIGLMVCQLVYNLFHVHCTLVPEPTLSLKVLLLFIRV